MLDVIKRYDKSIMIFKHCKYFRHEATIERNYDGTEKDIYDYFKWYIETGYV